jgi:hypothetical protein
VRLFLSLDNPKNANDDENNLEDSGEMVCLC